MTGAVKKRKYPKYNKNGTLRAPPPPPYGNKYAVGCTTNGRPTSYKPEYVEQAQKLCQLGATDVEMARFFNVHIDTYYQWRAVHPEFSEAIKAGKAVADERMKRSLYQSGIGYNIPVVKVERRLVGVGADAKMEVVKETSWAEHIPGDVGAQKMWLCNRLPKEWRDKTEHTHEVMPEMTLDEARERLIAFLIENGIQLALPPPVIEGEAEESDGGG